MKVIGAIIGSVAIGVLIWYITRRLSEAQPISGPEQNEAVRVPTKQYTERGFEVYG